MLWQSLCDFDLWPLYLIALTFAIPVGPSEQYFTLTLRNLAFGTYSSNLLTIPASVMVRITWAQPLTHMLTVLNPRPP